MNEDDYGMLIVIIGLVRMHKEITDRHEQRIKELQKQIEQMKEQIQNLIDYDPYWEY